MTFVSELRSKPDVFEQSGHGGVAMPVDELAESAIAKTSPLKVFRLLGGQPLARDRIAAFRGLGVLPIWTISMSSVASSQVAKARKASCRWRTRFLTGSGIRFARRSSSFSLASRAMAKRWIRATDR